MQAEAERDFIGTEKYKKL